MIKQKFKTGNRVVLISGGPSMTVVRYEPSDGEEVICQWFNKNELSEKAFHQDVLKPYQAPTIRAIIP